MKDVSQNPSLYERKQALQASQMQMAELREEKAGYRHEKGKIRHRHVAPFAEPNAEGNVIKKSAANVSSPPFGRDI